MTTHTPTPYITIGPYFPWEFSDVHYDLTQHNGHQAKGERILLTGRILELGGKPTLNTIIEIWQPDANGIFRNPLDPRSAQADPGFFGWGRARTDADAWYKFITVKPGASREADGTVRCPHANVMIVAVGITRNLVTTVFFPDKPGSVSDPVLDCVAPADRPKLYAQRDPSLDANGLKAYRFDIVMRGENETPFFLD